MGSPAFVAMIIVLLPTRTETLESSLNLLAFAYHVPGQSLDKPFVHVAHLTFFTVGGEGGRSCRSLWAWASYAHFGQCLASV